MTNSETEEAGETRTWPPAPTLQIPSSRKKLGLFRPLADVPVWVVPLVAFGDILVFTALYFLRHYFGHRPIVWVDAFILGPVSGLMPFGVFLWGWLTAGKRRRNKGG